MAFSFPKKPRIFPDEYIHVPNRGFDFYPQKCAYPPFRHQSQPFLPQGAHYVVIPFQDI